MEENTIMGAKINTQLSKISGIISEFCHKRERSFPEKCEQKCQDNADNDTSNKGKIEGEVIPLNVNVSGNSTDPWDPILYHKDQSHKDENPPSDQQHLAHSTEIHPSCPYRLRWRLIFSALCLLSPIPLLFAVDTTTVLLAIQARGFGFPDPFLPPFPKVLIIEGY